MLRYTTVLFLVLSTFAQAREANRPVARDARESAAPQDFESGFVSGFTKTCVQGQVGRPGNELLSEKLITEICNCGARETIVLLNKQDVELMVRGKTPKTMDQKLDRAIDVCVKRMSSDDKQ